MSSSAQNEAIGGLPGNQLPQPQVENEMSSKAVHNQSNP